MSEDEADLELLDLLRKSLGIGTNLNAAPDTRVLKDAEYIYNNSIDVALDMRGTKSAAAIIYDKMKIKSYSTTNWSDHPYHPKTKDESTVDFIFTLDLLNFSFWSERSTEERFAVEFEGKKWTGYASLTASLQRALEENIPITDPSFWINEEECTEEVLRNVFRSATEEEIPLFDKRVACLREAGRVLDEVVNLLASNFECFRDEGRFDGRSVRFQKRAQIFVADLWAAFDGDGYGRFDDIDTITMFADYRIPQMLHTLGCISYSPWLDGKIRRLELVESGSSAEMQIRGCSIWCVELLRREIVHNHPDAKVNAILIDYFLYDTIKEIEKEGLEQMPHHRTRSIWY
ncbi:hypothetical protein M501DRAFT_417572 [Patellaria atrata CBS 101060]|uniref:Queuosine 5'-phosphate N-glycosylase/hydrolase n=1 Tax=Patellaria atrata CBS 101060 TaxID=1346257 RepID=A0A9P4SHK6_9PEZI|nr:hypothetical protein M501DRAFT_417572 [Patellaria atrata CBS 101060]